MKAFRIFINWLFLILVIIPFGGLIVMVRLIFEAKIKKHSIERKIVSGHEWFWKEMF